MGSTYLAVDKLDQTQKRQCNKMDNTFLDPDLLDQQVEHDPEPNPPVIKSAPCVLMEGLLKTLLNICKVPHRHNHNHDNDVYQQESLNLDSNSSDSVFDVPVVSDTPFIPESKEDLNNASGQNDDENQPLEANHTRSVSAVDLVLSQSQSGESKKPDLKEQLKLPLNVSQADNFAFNLVPTPRDPQMSFLEKKEVKTDSTAGYYDIRRSLYQHLPKNSHHREKISVWNHIDQGTLFRVFQHVLNWKDPANLMSCRQVSKKWKNVTDQVVQENAITAKQDLKIEDLEYIFEKIHNSDDISVQQYDSIDMDAFQNGNGDMHSYEKGVESKFKGVGNSNPLRMIDLMGFTVSGEGDLNINQDIVLCNGKIQLYGSVVVESPTIVLKDLEIERQLTQKQISGNCSFQGTLEKPNELQQILFNSVRGGEYWIMNNVHIKQNLFTGLMCTCDEQIEVYPLLVLSWCEFEAVKREIPHNNKCCTLHRCQVHFFDTVFEGKKAIVMKGGKDDPKLRLIKVHRCNVDRVGRSFDGGMHYNLVIGDAMGQILQPDLRRISSRGHPY